MNLQRQKLRRNDDGAALLMSLMVIMLASTLSLAVAGSILAQVNPSQVSRKLARAVSAAEAGIDVAQKNIRTAEAALVPILPCGPFQGEVGGDDGSTYFVTVQYYNQDPIGRPDGWLNNPVVHLACPLGGLAVPGIWWALLTSKGSGPPIPGVRATAAERTLTSVIKASAGLPALGFTAGTSGDGWEALFVDGNIYNVFHHYPALSVRGAMVDCHDKITGLTCTGWTPGGMYASSTAGTPFGSSLVPSGADDLHTATLLNAAVDYATSRVYVAAGKKDTYQLGVACLDLIRKESCGFTQLTTGVHLNEDWAEVEFTGGAQIGTQYYVGGPEAKIYCFDYSTPTKECASFPATGLVVTGFSGALGGPWARKTTPVSNLATFGGPYVFAALANSRDFAKKDLICINTADNWSACPGFPQVDVTDYTGSANSTLMPILSPAGAVIGICTVTAADFVLASYACFSVIDGSPMTAPWGSHVGLPGAYGFGDPLRVGTKLFVALATGVEPDFTATYTCWDFSIVTVPAGGAPCAGFTSSSSGMVVEPYTLRQDRDNPTCIWEAGDAGVFEVFHRDTGEIGTCDPG